MEGGAGERELFGVARLTSGEGTGGEQAEDEEDEHGGEENGGMLGGESEAGGEAGDCEAGKRGAGDVAPEGVDGGEDGAGSGHVGGDVGAVGEEVGVKGEEGEGDETGAEGEHLARGEEDQQSAGEGEEHGEHADAEDEGFRGVVAAVGGAVVEEELAAVEVGLGFEEAVLERRGGEVERKEGEGGEQLDHGRMLGIEAEVVGLPGFVAGEDVVVLVPGEGLAVDGVDDFGGHDEEEGEDGGDGPSGSVRGGGSEFCCHSVVGE